MKKNSSVTAILVVNLVLMGWFMMFGFNFDKVSSTSVKNDIKNKIDYSYLLVTNGDEIEATADAFRNDNIKFTVLHRSVGYVNNNDNIVSAEIGLIDKTDNKVVFNVSDGKSEEELQEGEVLVSTDFAEKNKIIIGDNVKFYIPDSSTNKTKEINVKAVGLYEAGNINPQTMVASEISDIAEINSDIFLISADNLDFMNNDKISKDVTVADISMVEDALEAMVGDYMFYFKNMCFICMVAVLIFILNMIFIEYYSNKEIVIIKAMGLSSKFLYKASYVKQVIVNVLGFASALGLYYIIVKFLLNSMMKAKPHLTIDVFIVPIIVFATIGILCSIVEHISITKNCTKYDMLREKE
jgi:predicted lysophospholipase L1 biosynthesis ABC-type transport system permease subunit